MATIQTSLEDLRAIIYDILDFSRIESGKLNVQHVRFELAEVVRDVVGLYNPFTTDKGLRLDLVLDRHLPQ